MNRLVVFYLVASVGATLHPSEIADLAAKERRTLAVFVLIASKSILKEFEKHSHDECMQNSVGEFTFVTQKAEELLAHRDYLLRDAIHAFENAFQEWSACYGVHTKPAYWQIAQRHATEMKTKRSLAIDKVIHGPDKYRYIEALKAIVQLLNRSAADVLRGLRQHESITCSEHTFEVLEKVRDNKNLPGPLDEEFVTHLMSTFRHAVHYAEKHCEQHRSLHHPLAHIIAHAFASYKQIESARIEMGAFEDHVRIALTGY